MSDEQLRADELVSAYLDGEATPAEIAEVEQDDALMARIEQLRSVRDAVAAPVAPMSAERRDQMIEAALAVADAETGHRREARIVPIHRRRETLLALSVAAAAILVAAVVSSGLITSGGGDESADVAAEAPTEMAGTSAAAQEDAEAAATTDDSADYGMAAEPMAEEEPMAQEQPMADEESMAAATTTVYAESAEEELMADEVAAAADAALAEAATESAAAEPEAEMAAPTDDDTADAPTEPSVSEDRRDADAADGAELDDGPAEQVVDLGTFESLEALFDDIAPRWSAALEEGAVADPGMCSAAVHEEALRLNVATGQTFVATVGVEDLMTFDARFVRRADGTATIIYAAPPGCETAAYEQAAPGE